MSHRARSAPGSGNLLCSAIEASAQEAASKRVRTALVIDDDEMVRSVLTAALQRAGFAVVEAGSGIEGIETYRRHPTDLVVVDLILPDIDGVDVILDLSWDYPEFKTVAISGGTGNLDFLDVAQRFGASGVLRKPFRVEEFLELVQDICKKVPQLGDGSDDLRRYQRFPVRILVAFAGEHVQGTGFAVNLSLRGCAVESPVLPSPGTSLTLHLTVPDHVLHLCIEMASVSWTSHQQFGVQFIWMDQTAKDALKATLRQLVT